MKGKDMALTVGLVVVGVLLAGAIMHWGEDVDPIRFASDGFDL